MSEGSSSDIEWNQDKALDENTRVSRRVNIRKAIEAQSKDRNSFRAKNKNLKNIGIGLRRLKTKISSTYDEDDDDEVVFYFGPQDFNSSLLDALKEDEKIELKNKQQNEEQKSQQAIGKMSAIAKADKESHKLGLKGLSKKIIGEKTNSVLVTTDTFGDALKENLAAKTNIKTKNIADKDTQFLIKGLKKVRSASLRDKDIDFLDNDRLDAKDLVKIGQTQNEEKTAKLILEKSGRKKLSKNTKKDKEQEKQKIKNLAKKLKAR